MAKHDSCGNVHCFLGSQHVEFVTAMNLSQEKERWIPFPATLAVALALQGEISKH